MYIFCPECDTKFIVRPEQIGENGRKVKCSRCEHVWHQEIEDDIYDIEPTILSPHPSAMDAIRPGVNLPALMPVKIQPYLYTLPILMFGMIVFMLVVLFSNNWSNNFILRNSALSIQSVNMDYKKDTNKLTVSYKILNSSSQNLKVPLVRLRFLDHNDRVVKSVIDDHTKISMLPNQYVEVKTELTLPSTVVKTMDLMVGNRIDFILR